MGATAYPVVAQLGRDREGALKRLVHTSDEVVQAVELLMRISKDHETCL